MILKKSYKNLYALEARRNLFLLVITTIGVFMTLPFVFMQQIASFGTNYGVAFKYASKDLLEKKNICLKFVTYENALLIIMVCGLAMMNGFILFSFLSSKKKQDFYFSMPVRRKALFWVSYLQGIVNAVAAFVINTTLVVSLAAMNNSLTVYFVGMLIQTIIMAMLIYFAVYSILVLACILSGKAITSLLTFTMFFTYGAFLDAVLNYYFDGQLASMLIIPSNFYLISPFSIMTRALTAASVIYARKNAIIFCGKYCMKDLIALVLIFVVSVIISRILFVKRNTGETGKAIVFPKIKRGLKAFAVALAGLCISVFTECFYDIESLKVAIAGLVVGIAISIFVVDLILENDWKNCFRNWKKQCLYVALSIVVFVTTIIYANVKEYHGFDNIPDEYTEEMALKDKCIVIKDTNLNSLHHDSYELDCVCSLYFPIYLQIGNQDRLDEFMEQVSVGKQSKLRIVNMESSLDYETSTDYIYDGSVFKVYSPNSTYTDGTRFKYLVKLEGQLINDNTVRVYYVLTDRKDYSMEDFQNDVSVYEGVDPVKCILAIEKEGDNHEK